MPQHPSNSATHAFSDVGLMLSLTASLPDPQSHLARQARKIAHRLAKGTRDRGLQRRAADLTAALLSEADADLMLEQDGLLDGGFDD